MSQQSQKLVPNLQPLQKKQILTSHNVQNSKSHNSNKKGDTSSHISNDKKPSPINSKKSEQMSKREWNAAYQNKDFNLMSQNGLKQQKTQKKASHKIVQNMQAKSKNSQHCIYWETAYLDQKFYLSDPNSLGKLRELQHQIQIQRQKLTQIEVNQKLDKSFLSQRDIQQDNPDNHNIECLTQINQSKLLERKINAEKDLFSLQQKYQTKIQQIKKKKSILKKQMGCGTNDKNLQVNQKQLQVQDKRQSTKKSVIKQNPPSEKKISAKPSQKPQKSIKKNELQLQKSNRNNEVKLSQRIKQKQQEQKELLSKKSEIKKQVSKKQCEIISKQEKQISMKVVKTNEQKGVSMRKDSKDRESQKKIIQDIDNPAEKDKSFKNESEKQKFSKNHEIQIKKSVKKSENKNSSQVNQQVILQKSIKKSQKQASIRPTNSKKNEQMKNSEKNNHQINASQRKTKNQIQVQNEISKNDLSQHMDKSVKNSNKELQKQKSHKSSFNASPQNMNSEKQISKISKNQKQESNFIPPTIRIHQASFRKTDKSVQWQQIQQSLPKSQVQYNTKQKIEPNYKKSKNQMPKIEKSQKSQKSYQSNKKSMTKQQDTVINKNKQEIPNQRIKYQQQKSNKSQKKNFQQQNLTQQMVQQISHSRVQSSINYSYQNEKKTPQQKKQIQLLSSRQQISQKSSVRNHNNQKIQNIKQSNNINQSKQFSKQATQKYLGQSQIYGYQQNKSQSAYQSQIYSQKKKTSFKIHSRQNSVKSKKSSSKHPSIEKKNSNTQFNRSFQQKQSFKSNIQEAKINKQQINRLHEQIQQLQQKLKKVQQKQQQMLKFQNNPSKVVNQIQVSHAGSGSETNSPLGKLTLANRLKLQAKLSLQGSTVHFNTFQQKMKRTAQQNQKLEKQRLQQQVFRLKKIIRDMQMEKIKSIEYDQVQSLAKIQFHKPSILDPVQNNHSRISQHLKASLNSDMLETRKNQQNTQTMNKDIKNQTGKIIKNSPKKYHIDSPKKYNRINAQKSKQFSQIAKEDQRGQAPLPLRKKAESLYGGKSRDLTKSDLINKFEQNDRNFHQFIETSRLVIQQPESYVQAVNNSIPETFGNKEISKLNTNNKNENSPNEKNDMARNYSQLLEKLKYQNPQQDIRAPQISVKNINILNLPETPNVNTTQDDLLEIAKKTYLLFAIKVEQDQSQLCMKKYKNCVMFTFGNNNQHTILWHYSGKFYFGGWKNLNDQGEGQKIGQGIQYIPSKHLYQGQFLAGKKNGTGIIKMSNGNIYDGQWIDGIKNGRGIYFEASTGTYYSGQWKDGKRDGYGVLKFSSNQFYQGTFSKSIKNGYGVQKFGNNDYYKGQYQKGKFHGKGKYCWSNGSSYEGDFVQGFRHGQGSWKSSRKGGDIYIGGYQNDKKCGYGRYVWANGCVYQGYFKNDLKNGKGRLVYQDGKQIKGFWQDGNLVSPDQQSRKVQDHQEQPLRRSIRASSLKGPHSISINDRRQAYQ